MVTPHLSSVQNDLAFCARILPQVSRTFALSIASLPSDLNPAIESAYLLCRIVDTIEDEADLPHRDRQRLFDRFDALMVSQRRDPTDFERDATQCIAKASPAETELMAHAGAVFRVFRSLPLAQRQAVQPHILDMSSGMREYSVRAHHHGSLRLSSLGDLERYCYFVAGTVGELLSKLFLLRHPDLDPSAFAFIRSNAVYFGLGLQLVNIVKDVADDLPRGACFLPQNLLAERNLPEADLLDPARRNDALAVLRTVCSRARRHLERAAAYIAAWPPGPCSEVRLFCMMPYLLALATLTEVEQGPNTLRPGRIPKVSREQVASLLAQANQAARSNSAFAAVCDDLAQPKNPVSYAV